MYIYIEREREVGRALVFSCYAHCVLSNQWDAGTSGYEMQVFFFSARTDGSVEERAHLWLLCLSASPSPLIIRRVPAKQPRSASNSVPSADHLEVHTLQIYHALSCSQSPALGRPSWICKTQNSFWKVSTPRICSASLIIIISQVELRWRMFHKCPVRPFHEHM